MNETDTKKDSPNGEINNDEQLAYNRPFNNCLLSAGHGLHGFLFQ